MSKRYSNKGHAARSPVQPPKDKSSLIAGIVGAGLGLLVIAAVVIAIVVGTNASNKTPESQVNMTQIQNEINSMTVSDFAASNEVTEYVKISVKGYGDIVVRLRPDVAPITVENFQKLVKDGYYNGKVFHRIRKNFMIQGGGFDATGTEHKTDTIKGEFSSNGVQNDLLHLRGVISMARTNVKDSASSQFFICDKTSPHLDGEYAAFGYVLAGMDTVDKIASVTTNLANDAPTTTVMINSITFVTPVK